MHLAASSARAAYNISRHAPLFTAASTVSHKGQPQPMNTDTYAKYIDAFFIDTIFSLISDLSKSYASSDCTLFRYAVMQDNTFGCWPATFDVPRCGTCAQLHIEARPTNLPTVLDDLTEDLQPNPFPSSVTAMLPEYTESEEHCSQSPYAPAYRAITSMRC